MKKIFILLFSLLMITSCTSQGIDNANSEYEKSEDVTNYVRMNFEDVGSVVIELYPEIAPETVENFQDLVKEGFYDGLTIHRVAEEFVIQGGDPSGDGSGGSEDTIKGEFYRNDGIERDISHTYGVISMARTQNMDSATSQFFICLENATSLDDLYAAFGKVVEGIEVIEELAKTEVTEGTETPIEAPIISSAEFVTKK